MKTILHCLLVLSLLQLKEAEAATAPELPATFSIILDSRSKNPNAERTSWPAPHKKMGFIRRMEYKFLEKRFKKYAAHQKTEAAPKNNALSTISLILGIIAAVTLFIPTAGVVALIAAPAALITGIIALSKNYNNNKSSRAQAIIGVTLGSIIIALFFVAIIVFLSGGWL
jgi:hypothetical protein